MSCGADCGLTVADAALRDSHIHLLRRRDRVSEPDAWLT